MWLRGEMNVDEAIGETVKCCVSYILKNAVNGRVYIEIEEDGSFIVQKPVTQNEK